jgi:DNA-binding response OmpR family regulator
MPHRILLVDDYEGVLDVFHTLLTSRNYVVDCAHDLAEVETRFLQNSYSLVITDLSLHRGESEGLLVLECLARQLLKPLIVVWSGNNSIEMEEKVLSLGADRFLPKPLVFKVLLENIEEMLSGAARHKPFRAPEEAGGQARLPMLRQFPGVRNSLRALPQPNLFSSHTR